MVSMTLTPARHTCRSFAEVNLSVMNTSTCDMWPMRTGAARSSFMRSQTSRTRRAFSMMARDDVDLERIEIQQRAILVERGSADHRGVDLELADHLHRRDPINAPSERRTGPPATITSMFGCGGKAPSRR